jgi:hypothetical protein
MPFEAQIAVDAPLDRPPQTRPHQFRPQTHLTYLAPLQALCWGHTDLRLSEPNPLHHLSKKSGFEE